MSKQHQFRWWRAELRGLRSAQAAPPPSHAGGVGQGAMVSSKRPGSVLKLSRSAMPRGALELEPLEPGGAGSSKPGSGRQSSASVMARVITLLSTSFQACGGCWGRGEGSLLRASPAAARPSSAQGSGQGQMYRGADRSKSQALQRPLGCAPPMRRPRRVPDHQRICVPTLSAAALMRCTMSSFAPRRSSTWPPSLKSGCWAGDLQGGSCNAIHIVATQWHDGVCLMKGTGPAQRVCLIRPGLVPPPAYTHH